MSPTPAPPLGPRASILVATLALAMLATWLPHYVLWPWWPDLDAWATIAQGWDAGILPYRDVVIFNFPGQIEVCWLLGKTFGWGRTWPFYAVDAALVVALGPLLATWGRRRLGSALPGLVSWFAVLAYYLNQDYSLVAQRDWQAPLLASLGLLAAQRWPGRGGAAASAALAAAGFAIRPHVVLLVPPILLALALDAPTRREAARRGVLFAAVFAGFALLAFAPLVVGGLVGDFVAGVRQASYGAGYGRVTPGSVAEGLARQLGLLDPGGAFASWKAAVGHLVGWRILFTLVAIAALVATAPADLRRASAPWLAALALALLYEPLHPKRHGYLSMPLRLVGGLSWGVLAGLALPRLAGRPRIATATLLLMLAAASPGVPAFCRPADAYDALIGRFERRVPASAAGHFYPAVEDAHPFSPYPWSEYRRTLDYLRRRTTPRTRVATVLRNFPFPAINGVVGRVSPLPAESGVIWLWSVNPKLEPAFIRALDDAPSGSVVVWSPDESPFHEGLLLTPLCEAIRRAYRPEARFREFEIWRKR